MKTFSLQQLRRPLSFLVVITTVWLLGYTLVIAELGDDKARLQSRERDLFRNLEQKSHMAANIHAYRKQMVQLQAMAIDLIEQFPTLVSPAQVHAQLADYATDNGARLSRFAYISDSAAEFFTVRHFEAAVIGNYEAIVNIITSVHTQAQIAHLKEISITRRDDGLHASFKLDYYQSRSTEEDDP